MVSLPYMKNLTSKQSYQQKETVSTISTKGQVTLPIRVRRHLGVDPNDKVAFVIEPTGDVKVKNVKYPDIQSLRGAAGFLKKSLSFKEMRQIAQEDRLERKYGK